MEDVFGFIIAVIFLCVGIYVLKNPYSEAQSYGREAGNMSKEWGWIPLVKVVYKTNANFYRSRFGIWFLRFWGIFAIILSTLILYSILAQNFL